MNWNGDDEEKEKEDGEKEEKVAGGRGKRNAMKGIETRWRGQE